MDNRHTGNCDPCRIKDEHVAAHYFCQTCVEYFCHQCSDKHLKELISKGHLVKVWKKDKLHYLPVTNFGKDNNCQQYSEHFKYSTSDVYDFEGEILETDSSKHSHLTGKCTIRLDSCSIAITEIANHVTFCWPFTCIRKYGSMDDKIFFFESGRRCEAGEGRYVLLTHDAVSLHKNMTNFIRLIEKKTHP
ncbi:uncharacterized protein LOC132745262 isoform X2 [Ruditapes philippinarum]|uniref:uncharacterized protein LOC132745262 isoform X2 n=1 Tax=Ruditapes philippinarum TaxID=129788 RepID=UPI00295BE863|nr:uncharacterized protein LOC132745262 isoform X2 [Ruditapes philippinarum]